MEAPPQVVPAESLPLEGADAEGQQLRQLAIDTDDQSLTQEQPETAKPEAQDSAQTSPDRATGAETTEKPDSPETSAERDEKGRFKPKVQAEGTEQPQKPETPYDKAKKEQERQKSVLANFEAEKQRERAAIAAERQQLELQRQQLQQQAAQSQAPRFNSQHLWQASEEFDANARKLLKEGDVDQANSQLDLSAKARAEAQKAWYYEQQEAAQQQMVAHRQKWEAVCAETIQQHPELGDPNSEIAKKMNELLTNEPIFGQVEDGFKKAYQVALFNQQYAEVSGLRDRAEKAEKQLKELQERTAITGSGAVPHVEPRSFDQMSEKEQEDYLRRNASAYDRERYAA